MFSRNIINSLMPLGSAWNIAPESDFDKLLNGISDNSEIVRIFLENLRYLRDPLRTTILSDLEKEFGIIPVSGSTEDERRQRLYSTMFQRNELPTYSTLQEKLRLSGFDVYVHANDPAVDPSIFLDQSFQMTAGDLLPGGNDAQCGEAEAYCGRVGGELLVNGDIFNQFPNYTIQCDEDDALCGEVEALCGQYDSIYLEEIEYNVPADDGYWPLIFFVGGNATRDPVTGEITEIEIAPIAIERKNEFKKIILQHKPLFSWAGLIVVFQ